jgi:hypothetical protein
LIFRKAFDSVIHSALFLKLLRAKIGGKFLALLKSLYSNISLRVIVNSHSLSNDFPSSVGDFQGDKLSRFEANLFITYKFIFENIFFKSGIQNTVE